MGIFTMEVAGLVINVTSRFDSTIEYCRAYLSDREPDCSIEVLDEDLVYEQSMAEKEAIKEGIRIRKYTNPHLERATILRKTASELVHRDTVMLHGSAIGIDGEAFLFTAACGTGKSTHARFWMEQFGNRAVMINDDKPFLQITSSGIFVCGSPWGGKHGLQSNVRLPLKGICFLRRGQDNVIRQVNPRNFTEELRHQIFIPYETEEQNRVYDLIDEISNFGSYWEMECTKDPVSALISYGAMSR